MKFALGIGVYFLAGGITMVSMFGGPVWFNVLDIAGAYLPMGYLGGRLGFTSPAKLSNQRRQYAAESADESTQ